MMVVCPLRWIYFLGDVTVRQIYGEFAAIVHRAQVGLDLRALPATTSGTLSPNVINCSQKSSSAGISAQICTVLYPTNSDHRRAESGRQSPRAV